MAAKKQGKKSAEWKRRSEAAKLGHKRRATRLAKEARARSLRAQKAAATRARNRAIEAEKKKRRSDAAKKREAAKRQARQKMKVAPSKATENDLLILRAMRAEWIDGNLDEVLRQIADEEGITASEAYTDYHFSPKASDYLAGALG